VRFIDINCDMGESFGPWKMGRDDEIMPYISSANIACGAHASDPNVMAATVALAKQHSVAVGAHPGFPDLQGFGRRAFRMSPAELRNLVLYQLGSLWAFARAEGIELHHVKPHGALYNMACADPAIARPIVEAVGQFSKSLAIYCLPSSFLEAETLSYGLEAVPEGFADRAYQPNGSLADRRSVDAVTSDPAFAAARARQLALGSVTCLDGSTIKLAVRTICIHGDTPGAPEIAAAVRSALVEQGLEISSSLDA
jgi:UPF0271 protein